MSVDEECKTDAEKAAYARGWWKAMETKRVPVTMAHRQTLWSKIDEKDKLTSYGLQLEAAHGFTGDMPDETGEQHEWAERVGLTCGKREWVGLTLEEILDTYRGPDGSDYVEYARGLEAILKEKNT